MATTLIRNAQAIVTVDREDRVLRGENILVQDNVIRYIGPEERPRTASSTPPTALCTPVW